MTDCMNLRAHLVTSSFTQASLNPKTASCASLKVKRLVGMYFPYLMQSVYVEPLIFPFLHYFSKETQHFESCLSFEEECLPVNLGFRKPICRFPIIQGHMTRTLSPRKNPWRKVVFLLRLSVDNKRYHGYAYPRWKERVCLYIHSHSWQSHWGCRFHIKVAAGSVPPWDTIRGGHLFSTTVFIVN